MHGEGGGGGRLRVGVVEWEGDLVLVMIHWDSYCRFHKGAVS